MSIQRSYEPQHFAQDSDDGRQHMISFSSPYSLIVTEDAMTYK